MKTFKEFLDESKQMGSGKASRFAPGKEDEVNAAKVSSLQSGRVGAYKIKVSIHAGSRAYERRPDLSPKDWNDILTRAIHELRKDKSKEKDVVVYSKEFQQGVVATHIPVSRTIKIITVLPKGKGNPKQGTEKVLVESFEFEDGWTTDDEFYEVIYV